MANKFLNLIERTIQRMTNGGMLVGDRVELVSDYKSKESFKTLSADIQDYITKMFTDNDLKKKGINIMASKKNPAPVFACVISGQSRKTSHNYLNDKAKRLGGSREWLLNNYVSTYVCSQLRAGRSLRDLQNKECNIDLLA